MVIVSVSVFVFVYKVPQQFEYTVPRVQILDFCLSAFDEVELLFEIFVSGVFYLAAMFPSPSFLRAKGWSRGGDFPACIQPEMLIYSEIPMTETKSPVLCSSM